MLVSAFLFLSSLAEALTGDTFYPADVPASSSGRMEPQGKVQRRMVITVPAPPFTASFTLSMEVMSTLPAGTFSR